MSLNERLRKLEANRLNVEQRLQLAKETIGNGGEIPEKYAKKTEDQILAECQIVLLGSDTGLPESNQDFRDAQRRGWSRFLGFDEFPETLPAPVGEILEKVMDRLDEIRPTPEPGEIDETFA